MNSFEAPEAADLIGFFVGAVSGGSLYRKSSFLLDSLGAQVFAPLVSIREEPHLLRGRGSALYGAEKAALERFTRAAVIQLSLRAGRRQAGGTRSIARSLRTKFPSQL